MIRPLLYARQFEILENWWNHRNKRNFERTRDKFTCWQVILHVLWTDLSLSDGMFWCLTFPRQPKCFLSYTQQHYCSEISFFFWAAVKRYFCLSNYYNVFLAAAFSAQKPIFQVNRIMDRISRQNFWLKEILLGICSNINY